MTRRQCSEDDIVQMLDEWWVSVVIVQLIVQLASVVSQFLSQGILVYGCVVWLKGYPVVNYEDIGVIQLYKMCLLLVNSYCTPLLLHIQPFYNTLFLCFVGYACTTVPHTLVPLSVSLQCFSFCLRPDPFNLPLPVNFLL